VVALSRVGDLVVVRQPPLLGPSGGLVAAALGEEEPGPFGRGGVEQAGHVHHRVQPACFVHRGQGGVRRSHRLADPAERAQPAIPLPQHQYLPAQLDASDHVLEGEVQLVALVQHLGDPHVRLAGVVGGVAAALDGEAEAVLVGAEGRAQPAAGPLHLAEGEAGRHDRLQLRCRPPLDDQRGQGALGVLHPSAQPVGIGQQPPRPEARTVFLSGHLGQRRPGVGCRPRAVSPHRRQLGS